MILKDKPLISEVVLSQQVAARIGEARASDAWAPATVPSLKSIKPGQKLFKPFEFKLKPFQILTAPKMTFPGSDKLKYHMVLKILRRGTTFSIETSWDMNWILNENSEKL
jgi:hypothetical protein